MVALEQHSHSAIENP